MAEVAITTDSSNPLGTRTGCQVSFPRKPPLSLLRGPSEIPHPSQWVPPTMEQREAWAKEEVPGFPDLFRRQVAGDPGKKAVTWISEKGTAEKKYTYGELDSKSRAISAKLLADWGASPQDRVVLVYPPGLDFIVAFIACLRSGVVAIPVYPPNLNDIARDLAKLTKIVKDCGATLVLTNSRYQGVKLLNFLHSWPGKQWQTTDNLKVSSLAQYTEKYTSGSTADPKGVMLTHTNIAHNMAECRRSLGLTPFSRFFSWLPQYHDLGLIVAYLTTLSSGAQGFYMSPMDFIRRPASWVQLMSTHKVTHSAAPNFALELTCRKFRTSLHSSTPLDLSSLEMLLNAAEPVRAHSIAKWNETFAPYGWHPAAMCPSYGLAEHVVGVSAWGKKVVQVGSGPTAKTLHSSGNLATYPLTARVAIVNPETLEECGEGEEGEIWARSSMVAKGYWGKPELSEETFQAQMKPGAPGSDDGFYLRTGDLGFVVEGELFVTGRAKDLIIVRGKNYYPQDIEATVEEASSEIRPGCCASFSIIGSELKTLHGQPPCSPSAVDSGSEDEGVAIVAELKEYPSSSKDLGALTADISRAVRLAQGLSPVVVALIPPRTIPKTTSGKIRRKETKAQLMKKGLRTLNKIQGVPQAETEAPLEAPLEEETVGAQLEALGKPEVPKPVDGAPATPGPMPESGTSASGECNPEEQAVEPGAVEEDRGKEESMKGKVNQLVEGKEGEEGLNAKAQQSRMEAMEGAGAEKAAAEEEEEDNDSPSKYDCMTMEEAVRKIMGLEEGLVLEPHQRLVCLGLTSLDGMTLMELIGHRTGRILEPEEVEGLTVQHLRDLDAGGKLPEVLIPPEAPKGGPEAAAPKCA